MDQLFTREKFNFMLCKKSTFPYFCIDLYTLLLSLKWVFYESSYKSCNDLSQLSSIFREENHEWYYIGKGIT